MKNFTSILLKQKKKVLVAVLVLAAVVVVTLFVYINWGKKLRPGGKTESSQKIAQKAIDYLNKNVLSGGATASLIEVTDEKDVYKIRLKIRETEYESYITKDGRFLFPEGIDLDKTSSQTPAAQTSLTIGNFSVSSESVCKENDKPIVYFFGSNGCPHCLWEHPVIEKVVKKFEGFISFHNNMDTQNEMDIFQKYSDGGIPTVVLGCKYYRVGSGESGGEETEIKNLTAVICKLTQNQPTDICQSVQDLINQVK